MRFGVAETRNGVEMVGGCVAFVAIEAVSRIAAVQLLHVAVAAHFCND